MMPGPARRGPGASAKQLDTVLLKVADAAVHMGYGEKWTVCQGARNTARESPAAEPAQILPYAVP